MRAFYAALGLWAETEYESAEIFPADLLVGPGHLAVSKPIACNTRRDLDVFYGDDTWSR
jgi:hypothetical protein